VVGQSKLSVKGRKKGGTVNENPENPPNKRKIEIGKGLKKKGKKTTRKKGNRKQVNKP